jgi:hypothetical protein
MQYIYDFVILYNLIVMPCGLVCRYHMASILRNIGIYGQVPTHTINIDISAIQTSFSYNIMSLN